MKLEFIPIKNQKFDIDRTINPFNCDCENCDFMNCPKKNYAVKMERKKYSVDEFWNEWKDEILKLNKPKRWQYNFHERYALMLTYDMINEFFDALCFNFPKGTYWQPVCPSSYDTEIGETVYEKIALVKFSRVGNEIELGYIKISNCTIQDYDCNERQYKLAEKIRESFFRVKEKVFAHYQEKDKDWKIGWLSPEGRHYPCSHCEHCTLAQLIGFGELLLEREGWVKVALEQEDGFFCNSRLLTAEQRNWLSLNGYNLEDY